MKKIFLSLFAALVMLPAAFPATGTGIDEKKIIRLVEELQAQACKEDSSDDEESENIRLPGLRIISNGGFSLVYVGRMGLNMLKLLAAFNSDDEEVRMLRKLTSKVRKVMVVDYENGPQKARERFSRAMAKELDGNELVMEVKDGGETMRIYGTTSKDGESVEDVVVFAPEDCTMVCLFGSIKLDDVAKLIDMDSE